MVYLHQSIGALTQELTNCNTSVHLEFLGKMVYSYARQERVLGCVLVGLVAFIILFPCSQFPFDLLISRYVGSLHRRNRKQKKAVIT